MLKDFFFFVFAEEKGFSLSCQCSVNLFAFHLFPHVHLLKYWTATDIAPLQQAHFAVRTESEQKADSQK